MAKEALVTVNKNAIRLRDNLIQKLFLTYSIEASHMRIYIIFKNAIEDILN